MPRRLLTAVIVLLALACAPTALATDYYVSSAGSDGNAGTSPAAAWRSVARVNNAALNPGDRVLFEGGATFGDAALMPSRSGASGAPITYGSFGAGRAVLPAGIWMRSVSWLRFDGLAIRGASQGIMSSGSGTGATDVTIANGEISSVGIGINSPNALDARWTITGNTISRIGDSGMIIQGSDFTIARNSIVDTGIDTAITYGKHGIYAKGARMRILDNTITNFHRNGVSTRYPDAVIEGNNISGGPAGVGYFQDATSGGTTFIRYNRISDVNDAGIYLNPGSVESFVIANNTIKVTAGSGMDLRSQPNVTVANNIVTGSFTYAAQFRSPTGTFSEHHNLWWGSGSPSFLWNGSQVSLSGLASSTGQASGDVVADPQLGTGMAPATTSRAVDGGSVAVTATSYLATCDGLPLHYCGAAPDIGGVEHVSAATPSALGAPTSPAVSNVTQTGLTLSWTATTDSRAVGYEVFRGGVLLGTTTSTSFPVTGLACGTQYTLGVRAVDVTGAASTSATTTATTAACTVSPPPPPAQPADTTAPAIAWVRPVDGQTVPLSFWALAQATDAGGVARVVFLHDNAVVCTELSAPYECQFKLGTGWHTLTARATDAAGNTSASTIRVKGSKSMRSLTGLRVARPASGAVVGRRFLVVARVPAAKAVRVRFSLDGRTKCVDKRPPFRCRMRGRAGRHHVVVRAFRSNGARTATVVFFRVRR